MIGIDGVQPYGVDRRAAHVVGHGAEGRVVLILDHERFRGLCAGNTLVVVAGYLGVDRAHAAVDGEDLFWKMTVNTAMTGMIAIKISASFQL